MISPSFQETHNSQIPALHLLQNLGYQYLTPSETLSLRGGKLGNVILDDILKTQLKTLNSITYKGKNYPFSDANIENAVNALKTISYDGLIRTNQKIYDILTLGKSLEQTIDGDTKSFALQYIDWKNPANNQFHVTEEFEVEKIASKETRRPDLVLFVNGIPLVVIECKKRNIGITQAISQHLRNQKASEIPNLFIYSQILIALSVNDAKYATTGTVPKFWSFWREESLQNNHLNTLINQPFTEAQKNKTFRSALDRHQDYLDQLQKVGPREITEQDRCLYSLCEPQRLLDLIFKFIVFDQPHKKIARYQQYNAVQNTLNRILNKDQAGRRQGGVIWHTQGSGKSLTMVMLAKAIALTPFISNPKIILVTDRKDLDFQLKGTFKNCELDPEQARTGTHLSQLINKPKTEIITTVINKFETALRSAAKNNSPDIFVLVDESHRSQYGSFNANMRGVFPKACYIGFTGTPLMKKEKNTAQKFGGIIDKYTMDQAVQDKAVVPLLYEGRHALQDVNQKTIDEWFERVSKNLSKKQKKDLKKKFSTANQLNKAEEKIKLIAYDISEHFFKNWHQTGFKAQVATQDKATALKYKKYLDEFGLVHSQVLISGPDSRENHEDIDEEPSDEVQSFWKKMMQKYGNEENYNQTLIEQFKKEKNPEIIIVVDKLLTGFDVPENTVLYITRSLKDHGLLQAIARVNRLCEGKDYGYIIDYYGILGNLDHALTTYGALADFAEEDLVGSILNIQTEVSKLPQRHTNLWQMFKTIKNQLDIEAFEIYLGDESLRPEFYRRLSIFSRTFALALSTVRFVEETSMEDMERYKKDLKFFSQLRESVKRRYAETVDFKEYEIKIQKLLDTYVGADEIVKITELVDIFDQEKFNQEVAKIANPASKADTIAHRLKKTIHERMAEDPVFYTKFSVLLMKTIDDWRKKRLSDAEYLAKISETSKAIQNRTGEDTPEILKGRNFAKAVYGQSLEMIKNQFKQQEARQISANLAMKIEETILRFKKVDWVQDGQTLNKMMNGIDDLIFELRDSTGLTLSTQEMDYFIQQVINIAKNQYAS
ncbi:MAG: type I restriction endonuclease subunit R [Deltaproteobacteria bacterium]|nr:type I restriction endonuclease subunit R [Deltaproteobacteria bacterium]